MALRSVLLVLFSVLVTACQSSTDEVLIRIDLSHERDEGRFTPESGDKVYIAGAFNDWDPEGLELIDGNWDWIAEAPFPAEFLPADDTLRFKFVIVSEHNRDLPNSGWEVIPNRSIPVSLLREQRPLFVFNEPWSPAIVRQVSFAVSMSNQQVLGFFDPAVDEVVVSGSFIEWDPSGISLEDPDGDMIFEATIPIEISPNKPEPYKYRIVQPEARADEYIPFEGWEQVDNRHIDVSEQRDSLQVDYFNDQMRVARFVFSREWLMDSLLVDLKRGDVLQVNLKMGSDTFLSDPLIVTNRAQYETSYAIPLNSADIAWRLVKNQYSVLTPYQVIEINHKGRSLLK